MLAAVVFAGEAFLNCPEADFDLVVARCGFVAASRQRDGDHRAWDQTASLSGREPFMERNASGMSS